MELTENQNYIFNPEALMMNAKSPMKQIEVCLVATKNYVFYIPVKTTSLFFFFDLIKKHKLFDGVSIEEGVQNLIKNSPTVEQLEQNFIALLEGNEKYVSKISEQSLFKFQSFLGKKTLRMKNSFSDWSSVTLKSKAKGKELLAFYEN
jgi:hypothetical protein